MKICSKCGIEKELNDFYKDAQIKDKHRPECKECSKARAALYRESHKKKKDIEIQGREEVILGTLLGDACIYRWLRPNKIKKNSYTYLFSFSQCIEDFCKWKADLIGLPYHIYKRDRFDNRTRKTYTSYDCHVRMSRSVASSYYDLFYTPKKGVSVKILNGLTDLSIAVWYMDDGCMYYNGNNCHLTLSTNGFLLDDNTLIIKWFEDRYGIFFKRCSGGGIRLTSNTECAKFMNIVEKYIPECMRYKMLSEARARYNNKLSNERKGSRNEKYK